MPRRGSLADLMQRGVVKSAWGDASDDEVIHRRSDTGDHISPDWLQARRREREERERLEREKIEAEKRQEAARQKVLAKQAAEKERKELAALAKLAEQEVARDELSMIEGFGSF